VHPTVVTVPVPCKDYNIEYIASPDCTVSSSLTKDEKHYEVNIIPSGLSSYAVLWAECLVSVFPHTLNQQQKDDIRVHIKKTLKIAEDSKLDKHFDRVWDLKSKCHILNRESFTLDEVQDVLTIILGSEI